MAAAAAVDADGCDPLVELQEQCVYCLSCDRPLKVLGCLHLTCLPCAQDRVRFDNTLRCVRCQAYTKPEAYRGLRVTEWLVDWPKYSSCHEPASRASLLQATTSEVGGSSCSSTAKEPGEISRGGSSPNGHSDSMRVEATQPEAGAPNGARSDSPKSSGEDESVDGAVAAAGENLPNDNDVGDPEGHSPARGIDESTVDEGDSADVYLEKMLLSAADEECHGKGGFPCCQDSDCEEFAEPAQMKCVDCAKLLCQSHAFVHKRSHKTHKHAQVLLSGAHCAASWCKLHTGQRLSVYCTWCRVMLCEKCARSSDHKMHELSSIAAGAQRERAKLISELAPEEFSDLEEPIDKIRRQITATNDKAEEISAAITDDFDSYRAKLDQRENELKHTLDQRRWEHVKLLEDELVALLETQRKVAASRHLCRQLDDHRFLTVSPAVAHTLELLDTSSSMCTVVPAMEATYEGFARSKFDEVCLYGNLRSNSLPELDPDTAKETARCALKNILILSQKVLSFNQESVSDGVTLCKVGSVLCIAGGSGAEENKGKWHACTASGSYCSGSVSVSVRLAGFAEQMFIGVAAHDVPVNNIDIRKWRDFYGWAGTEEYIAGTKGGKLGQPWQDGDVIHLNLDCDRHALSAFHDRSRVLQCIEVPPEWLCFRMEFLEGCTVSLIP